MRKSLLILCVLLAVFMFGCGKSETTSNSNTSSTSSNSNKSTSTSSSETTTSSTTSSSSEEKIGVPECDDFIAKYDACVSSKVPESARAQYKNALAQWRESWRNLAKNPATKATMVTVCKQAAEQQAAALKTYGCSF